MNSPLPSDDSRRESRIAEALLEYYRRIVQGRPVSQDDFADEYADVADDLREHWETEQAVNHAASEMKFEERSAPAIAGERIRYFGEYELLDEIDRGGMGIVFRARQLRLDRIVALKMLRPELLDDAEFLARFQIEAHAAAQLKHANIVGVYDAPARVPP